MTNISIQRLNRWIEKAFNIKGGPTLLDVESAIRTVYVIQDGVETRAHQGWNRYFTTVTAAAVAAQLAAVRLRNPAGSNVIAVVEFANAFGSVTDQPLLILQAGATDFAGAVVSQRCDPRGQLLPTLIATKGNNASFTGGPSIQGAFPANSAFQFIGTLDQEIVCAPGDSVTIWSSVANQNLNVSYMWRERALETSELTG